MFRTPFWVKKIINKLTGNVTVSSLDTGQGFLDKTSPFDSFIYIFDGKAEIIIDGISKVLETGDGIVIPANHSNSITANERFKMIATVIKTRQY